MPVEAAEERSLADTLVGLDVLDVATPTGPGRARRAWTATWPKLLALGLLVGVWQLAIELEWREPYQLAPPSEVVPRLGRDLADGLVGTAVRVTMLRMLKGYLYSLVGGVVLGVAVARSRVVRSGVGAFITGLQTMPSVAWFPLALLLFGVSEQAIFAVVVLGALPSIANGVIAGVDTVPPLLTRAGRVLGARGLAMYRHVVLPAAMPSFVGGLKQGWAFAWRSLMAGELIVLIPNKQSLGSLLTIRRELSDSDGLLAVMVVILVIGILVDSLVFSRLERVVRRRWGLLQP